MHKLIDRPLAVHHAPRWEKAVDKIHPDALLTALTGFGVPPRLTALINNYTSPQFVVFAAGHTSSRAQAQAGIRQGAYIQRTYLFLRLGTHSRWAIVAVALQPEPAMLTRMGLPCLPARLSGGRRSQQSAPQLEEVYSSSFTSQNKHHIPTRHPTHHRNPCQVPESHPQQRWLHTQRHHHPASHSRKHFHGPH